jgi:hypothetical protein
MNNEIYSKSENDEDFYLKFLNARILGNKYDYLDMQN